MTRLKHIVAYMVFSCLIYFAVSCEGEQETPGPTIYLTATEYEIDVTDTLTLSPKITYDQHSSYQWLLDGEILSTEKDLTIIPKTPQTLNLQFVVATPNGSDTCDITVQALYILDFEEFELEADTADYGQGGTQSFTSKGVTFPVAYEGSGISWNGYALSTGTIKTSSNSKIRYSAYPGYGSDKSSLFMVYHQPTDGTPMQIRFEEGVARTLKSVDVTNTSYLYYVIKNGLDVSAKFGEGKADWYLLTAIGYDADGLKTGETAFYLADYRDNVKTKRYMVEAWTKLDLGDLGAVNRIEFVLTSSDTDENGMATPGYFCLDNLKIVD
ncbi:MAG: DUF4465 domain-containing protein [Breznakibacter sp.]